LRHAKRDDFRVAGGKRIAMKNAAATVAEDDSFVLSSLPPTRAQKRLTLVLCWAYWSSLSWLPQVRCLAFI
jgi:hypothetical protein